MSNYMYIVNNTYYFRKKIPNSICDGNQTLRVSLKKMLGKTLYYQLISKSTVSSFVHYLNNQLDGFFRKKELLSMQEINDFVKELLERYKQKATIVETNSDLDFIHNIGSTDNQVEEKRFNDLGYYEDSGKYVAGHTYQALDREIISLRSAYDSNKMSNLANAAKNILSRQDIIKDSELDNIPEGMQKLFFEALLKIEMQVLSQDMQNYESNTSFERPKEIDQDDMISKIIAQLKSNGDLQDAQIIQESFQMQDDWDTLISDFVNNKEKEGQKNNSLRVAVIDINTLKELMLGDPNFNIKTRLLLNTTLDDIIYLREQIKVLPDLRQVEIKHIKDRGIYYLINKARKDNLRLISFGGMQAKVKTINAFIKFLKDTDPIYEELNIGLWDRLLITEKQLNTNQLIQKDHDTKLALSSNDLREFLLQKYPNDSQGKKNFKVHTGKSPHIFWGFVLSMYSGARSQELAQLKVSDFFKTIINDKVIFSFKIQITDYEMQSLKNTSSKRSIPLHPKIIELGFLNYLKYRIDMKYEWLFTLDTNVDGKKSGFSKSWNTIFKQWFKENRADCIGKPPSFHSLRDHYITRFLQHKENEQRFNLVNLKKLVGHSAKTEKDVTVDSYYKENIDIEFAYDLVCNIDFNIDEAHLKLKKLIEQKEPILYDIDLEKIIVI